MCNHDHAYQVEFCDAIKRHFFGPNAVLVYMHSDQFGRRIGLGAEPAQEGGYDWAVHLLIEPDGWWPKLVEVALPDWETIWYLPMGDCRCLIADEVRDLMHVVGRLLLERVLQEKSIATPRRACLMSQLPN
jgi:hypothetical protein